MQAEQAGPLTSGQTLVLQKRGRGRRPKGHSSKRERTQTGMVQFINTIPGEVLGSTGNIRLIRSHAARQSRALQWEAKQRQRWTTTTAPNEDTTSGVVDEEEEAEDEISPTVIDEQLSQLAIGVQPRYRRLAPKPQTTTSRRTTSRSPSPIQLVGGARKDAYHTFARSMSEDEYYLFDFCKFNHTHPALRLTHQISIMSSYTAIKHATIKKTTRSFKHR